MTEKQELGETVEKLWSHINSKTPEWLKEKGDYLGWLIVYRQEEGVALAATDETPLTSRTMPFGEDDQVSTELALPSMGAQVIYIPKLSDDVPVRKYIFTRKMKKPMVGPKGIEYVPLSGIGVSAGHAQMTIAGRAGELVSLTDMSSNGTYRRRFGEMKKIHQNTSGLKTGDQIFILPSHTVEFQTSETIHSRLAEITRANKWHYSK